MKPRQPAPAGCKVPIPAETQDEENHPFSARAVGKTARVFLVLPANFHAHSAHHKKIKAARA